MFQQPIDFRDESDALHAIIAPLQEADFERKTLFKDWTINDVLTHLHFWNQAADLSLTDEPKFMEFLGKVMQAMPSIGLRAFEDQWYEGIAGRELLTTWHDFYQGMADRWSAEDPAKRLKWAGPDMSVRSSITARLMETWAHGQEVFDLLGEDRQNTDRIKNIAHLGVSTYGWTFKNRRMEPPGPPPQVKLTAPSGATWEWNDADAGSSVTGSAEEFCQVVTQTRGFTDTNLVATGEAAQKWMEIAQCFAGPAEAPPEKGARHMA